MGEFIPHDILGAVVGAGLSFGVTIAVATRLQKEKPWILATLLGALIVIGFIFVGIAVDLTAHGWSH